MRAKQMPAFAFIVVTEPLTPEQRAAIGWAGREGIEDGRNFMHFYRLTPDNRILMGGGPGFVPFGGRMDHDAYPAAWQHLEEFIGTTFPALRGIRIDYRWGGGFSVTANSTPQIGTMHDGAAVYSIGCTGHGVAMTHMNGRIIRDLVLGTKDRADRAVVRQPPLHAAAARAVPLARRQGGHGRHGARRLVVRSRDERAMRPIKKIAMIGATGMLGIPVAIALMEAGFEVTALARNPASARRSLPAAIAIVQADVRDEESLRQGLRGQDGVYLSLSVAPGQRQGDFHTEVQGLEHILAAARETKIARVAYLSALVHDTKMISPPASACCGWPWRAPPDTSRRSPLPARRR